MRLRIARAAALLALTAAVLPVATAQAGRKPVTCSVKHSTTVARHGEQRLITREGADDDFYGPSTRVYACRQAHRPAVLLDETDTGTSIEIGGVRFTRWYVVYSASGSSSQCTKYQPEAPECYFSYVASYDLRTGRRRAISQGDAASLVLSTKGWFAWVTAPDTLGSRSVIGVDGEGAHTLDQGGIDAASLGFSGARLGWKRTDGTAQSATLG